MNIRILKEKYKTIPYIISILLVLFFVTKLIYEFVFLK